MAINPTAASLLGFLHDGEMSGYEQLLRFAEDHRQMHADRLAEYSQRQKLLDDPYLGAVLAFGTHYERAVLAWMDELPELLSPGR